MEDSNSTGGGEVAAEGERRLPWTQDQTGAPVAREGAPQGARPEWEGSPGKEWRRRKTVLKPTQVDGCVRYQGQGRSPVKELGKITP